MGWREHGNDTAGQGESKAMAWCDLLWRWELLAGGEDEWWIWKAMRTQGDHTASNSKRDEEEMVEPTRSPPRLACPLSPVPSPARTLATLADARGAAPVHDAGGHGAEDDGHAEEADPPDDPRQHRLWQQLRQLRAGRVHLHPCHTQGTPSGRHSPAHVTTCHQHHGHTAKPQLLLHQGCSALRGTWAPHHGHQERGCSGL